MSAYITGAGKFLPGSPIPSERIEEYIGSVGANSSRLRDRVIANSGIAQRHYAIDTEQRSRHSCASMAAEAIRAAVADAGRALDDIELLAVATTINDVLAPGVASMVHGELANAPCEIASLGGICASGMMAMKNAFLQVKTGEKALAVAAATEFASRIMKSSRFVGQPHLDADGQVAREIAFLRYMLSDGAGAVVVADRPRPDGVSLRIDWISLRSFANRTPAVMYCGTPDTNGHTRSWLDYETSESAAADGAIALRQHLPKLPGLLEVVAEEYERLWRAGSIDPSRIKRIVAHYSSEILKPAGLRELNRRGVELPPESTWYSNLRHAGNIGCASVYVMLAETVAERFLEPGDQVLVFCPESGRYAVSFALLTAVGPDGEEA